MDPSAASRVNSFPVRAQATSEGFHITSPPPTPLLGGDRPPLSGTNRPPSPYSGLRDDWAVATAAPGVTPPFLAGAYGASFPAPPTASGRLPAGRTPSAAR